MAASGEHRYWAQRTRALRRVEQGHSQAARRWSLEMRTLEGLHHELDPCMVARAEK